jgi:hypothetical protein
MMMHMRGCEVMNVILSYGCWCSMSKEQNTRSAITHDDVEQTSPKAFAPLKCAKLPSFRTVYLSGRRRLPTDALELR